MREEMITTREIAIRRVSVTTSKSFEDVMGAIDAAIGHPNMVQFSKDIAASPSYADLERVVQAAIGRSGLMEFARFDIGAVLTKSTGRAGARSLHLVMGNPIIMQAMARHVTDAGAYAPVTLLVDGRPDGVHLSYDEMTSLLAPYGSPEALQVARDLDDKIEKLLLEVAG
jgi:hypothetical protein